jgi:hypothetical protein
LLGWRTSSITEALTRAVEALRREQFFADRTAAYAANPRAAADEREEALWERTVVDGPEHEAPYGGEPGGHGRRPSAAKCDL